jgi:hypothetical protein
MRMDGRTISRPMGTAVWRAAVLAASIFPSIVTASSLLSLGPRTLQTLLVEQLFAQKGRWYLIDDGAVCFTYLESPRVHLEMDRLVLNAHLASRLGQRIGSACAGADFVSNVTLSARIRGAEHKLLFEDIRIEHVDDESTRNALNLALQLDPQALPRTASIDVFEFMQKQMASAAASATRLQQFRISTITTRNDAVVIQFDLSLTAP